MDETPGNEEIQARGRSGERIQQAMNGWNTDIPKAPGYYLRVNAGHGISLHRIDKRGRYLWIFWGGATDMSGWMKSYQKQWKYKLSGWQWFGPIPEPDIERRLPRRER